MSNCSQTHGAVIVVGLVPSGPSGVKDYGHALARELGRRGLNVGELWFQNDGVKLDSSIRSSVRLLARAFSIPRCSVVLWQYSPFAYAVRGVPLPGIFLGIVLRARHIPVVTVLHELAYPWGRRGLAGRLFSLTQHAALLPVLAGSSAVVVTTDQRARMLRKWRWPPARPPVHVVPVFSTMMIGGAPNQSEAEDNSPRLGIIGYASDGVQAELFFDAMRHLKSLAGLRVILLGGPGPLAEGGKRWVQLARTAGMEDLIEFTGVIPLAALSVQVSSCAVITLLDEEGPSSRRTMLAAALALGRPTVSTDGRNRWVDAIEKGAIAVVPPDADLLGKALRRLFEDPDERSAMSARAYEYYAREMSIEKAGESIAAVIATVRK